VGVVNGAWEVYPRISVLFQATLLSIQLPLQFYTSFTSYMIGTAMAFVIPLVFMFATIIGTVCQPRKHFRLISRAALEGIGLLLVFVVVHTFVFVLTVW
jgi:hypothetical protein